MSRVELANPVAKKKPYAVSAQIGADKSDAQTGAVRACPPRHRLGKLRPRTSGDGFDDTPEAALKFAVVESLIVKEKRRVQGNCRNTFQKRPARVTEKTRFEFAETGSETGIAVGNVLLIQIHQRQRQIADKLHFEPIGLQARDRIEGFASGFNLTCGGLGEAELKLQFNRTRRQRMRAFE